MTNSDMPTDMSLSTAIDQALQAERITAAAPIDVDVEGGAVTLSGAVASHLIKDTAERVAQNTPGVSIVINNLAVGQRGDGGVVSMLETQGQREHRGRCPTRPRAL